MVSLTMVFKLRLSGSKGIIEVTSRALCSWCGLAVRRGSLINTTKKVLVEDLKESAVCSAGSVSASTTLSPPQTPQAKLSEMLVFFMVVRLLK